jgi:hypothetical protein
MAKADHIALFRIAQGYRRKRGLCASRRHVENLPHDVDSDVGAGRRPERLLEKLAFKCFRLFAQSSKA